MRGLLLIGCFLVFWIGSGVLEDLDRKDLPFQKDQDDIAVLSGYNYMHAVMEDNQFIVLHVYDQHKVLAKTYNDSDLNQLIPSATFKALVEENDGLYLIFEEQNSSETKKKLVVGPRGSVTFVPERY
ncbi:hypothetical protein Q9251_03490 [Alkalihalobacillus macyae]|uniref:hypothetical protein n=1 Tax=Guptibacillus hwajinpoensis TaxID=208199 RepID=UPI00273BA2B2|nr:hypothetical protein [Alkalihalobacillus macyae]MDP4549940.1 hypothetical protein [Alkalihalobacillus macyae]